MPDWITPVKAEGGVRRFRLHQTESFHKYHTVNAHKTQERRPIISTIQRPNDKTAVLYKRIGSTNYKIRVHFSETSKETINDKIVHLIQNEGLSSAAERDIIETPQMSRPPEGSS